MCGILCYIQINGEIDLSKVLAALDKLNDRGPDKKQYKIIKYNNIQILMGFTRLAIKDTSDAGLQPFIDYNDNCVICNGEIYNYKELAKKYEIKMKTQCDCEIILPLFKKNGFFEMIQNDLDAEFATVIYDNINKSIHFARDRYGVRPLYYGYNKTTNSIAIGSELKALHSLMDFVEQVKPNMYGKIELNNIGQDLENTIKFSQYYNYDKLEFYNNKDSVDVIHQNINKLLTDAVEKRLDSDVPIGFLLSGGLDSSLIVAIATKILGPEKITCFSIGFDKSPDVEAAKKVVKFLGIKNHHIVPFDVNTGLWAISDIIQKVETYDITTIRASTPQYILAKYVQEKTNVRVLLSGEGSDEITCGYKYFRYAPNSKELHSESIKLLRELCYYDNKRTDRTMAGNGLEVRVPFLDFKYVEYITTINPELLMYRTDYIEKKIVRDSFVGYLPDEILYRPKEAFSDAVSNKETIWYHAIRDMAETAISDDELNNNKYDINKPELKEALYYRKIFDYYYPGRDNVLPHYWLPKWVNEKDPSATVLKK